MKITRFFDYALMFYIAVWVMVFPYVSVTIFLEGINDGHVSIIAVSMAHSIVGLFMIEDKNLFMWYRSLLVIFAVSFLIFLSLKNADKYRCVGRASNSLCIEELNIGREK